MQDGANLEKELKADHQTSVDQALERIERILSTVTVGLEILTGICAGLEDFEEFDEEGEAANEGTHGARRAFRLTSCR